MAGYIQGGRVPRDASVGSSRQQGPSVSSSESSERVDEVRVGAVTLHPLWYPFTNRYTILFSLQVLRSTLSNKRARSSA
jgi:hypothetical protein